MCLVQTKEQRILSRIRKKGLSRLDLYLSNLTRREVLSLDMKLLTWCCLSLLAYFHQRAHQGRFFQRQKFHNAKYLFHNTVHLVLPDKEKEVIKYSITYFKATNQWHLEEFVALTFEVISRIKIFPPLLS